MLKISDVNLDALDIQFAAKSNEEDNNKWLPLWIHLIDTAVVMNFLQEKWISSCYSSYEGSLEKVKQVGIFVAAIHDIGKITPAFQWMIAPKINGYVETLEEYGIALTKHFTDDERKQFGHHAEGGALLLNNYGLCREVAVVVASHHGIIPNKGYTDEYSSKLVLHPNLFFENKNKTTWEKIQKDYLTFALQLSGFCSVKEIPAIDKETQMIMSGLLITADWIASNCEYFPLVNRNVSNEKLMKEISIRGKSGLDLLRFPQKWEPERKMQNNDLIQSSFGFSANSMQKKVQQIAQNIVQPGLFIIEAPMGIGKTEASLALAEIFASKMKKSGLAFFLPSQATSNALFTRLEDWARKQTNGSVLAMQLAHSSFLLNEDFNKLPKNEYENSGNPGLVAHQFFCGSKSFLLSNFVVGTIDQLLMAAMQQKHVMLKHLGLADKVIIIDECHAYDAYMNKYLDRILRFLYQYKVPVIILSATLPARRRMELLNAYGDGNENIDQEKFKDERRYPLLSWRENERVFCEAVENINQDEKKVFIEQLAEKEIVNKVVQFANDGACIGIIVNTVSKAQKLTERLMKNSEDKVILYHAQYLLPDRIEKEKSILHSVGKYSESKERCGKIIIGTQVLEQSLDIDFDVLVTDICPTDLLLQRIGRMHRHRRQRPSGYEKATCYVIGLFEDELDKGTEAIYGRYLIKKTRSLLPNSILLPTDISSLVQETYDESFIPPDLEVDYNLFRANRENQERRAQNFLLAPIQYGRRMAKTIEGLSGNGISEDSARASVRDGDSSVEVIVISETENGEYKLIASTNNDLIFSANKKPNSKLAKEIAKQKLRLPRCLSNKWNATQIVDCLRTETNNKLGFLQTSPWLYDELFLILDQNYRKNLLERYQIQYSIEFGLVVKEGENK